MDDSLPDDYIRRQFFVIGLGNRLGDEFVAELNKSNRDSRAILLDMLPGIFEKRPLSRIRADKLEGLADEVSASRGERIARFREDFERVLEVLIRGEFKKSNEIYSSIPLPLEPDEDPTPFIPILLANGIYDGKTIDEWFTDFSGADRARTGQSISAGVNNGETEAAIAKGLLGTKAMGYSDGDLNASNNSARRLARTVTAGIANQARAAWAQSFKKKLPKSVGLLEVYSAILDSRTSFVCASLSGNVYPLGEGPYPPIHRNCRSSRYPVPRVVAHPSELAVTGVDFSKNARRRVGGKKWDGMGASAHRAEVLIEKKRWIDKNIGILPEKMDFEPWFSRQPASFQREYLGSTRYGAWRSGNFEIGDFVAPSGARYTIEQLANKGIL